MRDNTWLKATVSGIVSYGAAEGVAKGLNIFSILMMSYLLEVSVFGQVSLLLMFELLFLEMVTAGQHQSVLRYGASKNLIKTTLLGMRISAVSFIFWVLVVSIFVENIFSISKSLLLLVLLAVLLQAYLQIFLASYRVAGLFNLYVMTRVGYQVLKLVALYILISSDRGVFSYPESLVYAGLLTLIVTAVFSSFHQSIRTGINTGEAPCLTSAIKVGFSLGLHAIAGVMYTFVDRIMISRLLDLESLGIYQLASTLGLSAFFFVNVVALYFTPKIYANSSNLTKARKIMNSFSVISAAGICIISTIVYLAAINYIHVFDESYLHIIPIFPYFVCILLVQIMNLYGLYGLTMLEKVKFIPVITALMLLTHFLLIQVLIPSMGLKGAVISLLFCEVLYAAFLFCLFYLEYKRKLHNFQ